MKNKILLLCASLFVTLSLQAKETICYKKDWLSPGTIETTTLDGGECNSAFSVIEMKEKGWNIKDIQVTSSKNGLNYTYIFTDVQPKVSKFLNAKKEVTIPSFDIQYTKVFDVTNSEAKINIPNLKKGQSGIVVHTYEDGKSVIVNNAHVMSSNENYSVLKLSQFDDLEQDAIPTTNRKSANGDTFILNYLYDASLLIAPTAQSFSVVREKFKKNNFLHADIFATHLKLENEPLPSKETFIKFSKFQNIGTVFFVVNNQVYVVDAKTFSVLHSYPVLYSNNDEQLPFYTRVAEIDKAFWDIDFDGYIDIIKDLVGANEQTEEEYLNEDLKLADGQKTHQENYEAYYMNLLGLTDVRQ